MPHCVPQRDASVESGHYEGGSHHVQLPEPEPGTLANGADLAVSGAPVTFLRPLIIACKIG